MKNKKKDTYLTAVLSALILVSLAGIGYVVFFHQEEFPEAVKTPLPKKHAAPAKTAVKEKKPVLPPEDLQGFVEKQASLPAPPAGVEKEKVVVAKIVPPRVPIRQVSVIIDDIGHDMKALRDLLRIDADITFAVLPLLPHSRDAAETLRRAHREILLHLPMEPLTYPKDKPGDGALFTEMSEEEIVAQVNKNLVSVPYASGVNNHMGSKFMSDEDKLFLVFQELRKKDLFFIDSRTTPSSKTLPAAKKARLTVGSRRVFLDNDRDYAKIYAILMQVAENSSGTAPLIVIGHPYPETIRALKDANKVFQEKGVRIIPVSKLLKNGPSGTS